MASESQTLDRPGVAERDRVVALLRGQEPELRSLGVKRLRLLGSLARGEAGPQSDVDLLAELDHLRESYDDYRADTMLRLALERCVEILSEASRHIPAEMKANHPEVPWKRVADIGNVLRHAYRSIDPHIMWEVATQHVTPLRNAAEQMLAEIEPEQKGGAARGPS